MKILCDVCGKGEASFYCAADEASLCAACDHRVHHANKLAGKHHRFSLVHPSPNQTPPLCDICQERSAFLFCLQDRAILCRECDIPIHKPNQRTQKHTRFLLTGVTLCSESPAESASTNLNDAVSKGTSQEPSEQSNSNLQFSTSSISEYLIETLPGWHVEDLLDSSSPSPSICRKNGENDPMLPLWDADFHSSNMGLWVPQVQVHQTQNQSFQSSLDNNCYHNNVTFGLTNGCSDRSSTNSIKSTRKRSESDNSFAVPQITPPSNAAFKRSRVFW